MSNDLEQRAKENDLRYTQLRDRLNELGFIHLRTDTTTFGIVHVINHNIYARKADGRKVIVAVETNSKLQIVNFDVYSEISTSIEWTKYFAAIDALAIPDPNDRIIRCAICKEQADGTTAYCPKCGGRLQFDPTSSATPDVDDEVLTVGKTKRLINDLPDVTTLGVRTVEDAGGKVKQMFLAYKAGDGRKIDLHEFKPQGPAVRI